MKAAETTSERRLVEQILAGDDDAFGKLVERHQIAMYNIAFRLLGNHEDARDVAQEAFWRAYRGLHGFDLDRPLIPWLYRIATNLSLNRLRRNPPATLSLDAPPLGREQDQATRDVPDPGRSPHDRMQQEEVQLRIRNAILSLAPSDRAVVELRHYQGLSYGEIASALGTTLSSVKSRLFRARRKLRAELADLME